MAVVSKLRIPIRPFPLSPDLILVRFQVVRTFAAKAERPPPSKFQLAPPKGENGHWKYERDYSRDSRYTKHDSKIKMADTYWRLMVWAAADHYELWLLYVLCGLACLMVLGIAYISFERIEVWVDRTSKTPPWDWARVREKYWKMPTVVYDPLGITHARLNIMEKLQDQMLEAAKERGTRDAKGYWVMDRK